MTCTILMMLILSISLWAKQEKVKQERKIIGLKIVGFTDDSVLKKEGAELGDLLVKYNGKKLASIQHLQELKQKVKKEKVKVVLKRDKAKITLKVPAGELGVYLQPVAKPHKIDKDAKVIKGIGKLGWDMGIENSFIASLWRIDEKFGSGMSYEDMVGLSGYAFRTQFHKDWCPSSPDATVGKDVGGELMEKLGYSYEYYLLQKPEIIDEESRKRMREKEEIEKIIIGSIDSGWPVMAVDLIEIPEWGIITGYQKDGKELFCRTYFDMTEDYEIAQKFPWVICVIKDKKKEVDLTDSYKHVLHFAKTLYETEKADDYYLGLSAITYWIEKLSDKEFFAGLDMEKFSQVNLANTWIVQSLSEARRIGGEFLKKHSEELGIDESVVEKMANIYQEEAEILSNMKEQGIVGPHFIQNKEQWTDEMREKQIESLKEIYKLEQEFHSLLEKI